MYGHKVKVIYWHFTKRELYILIQNNFNKDDNYANLYNQH